MVVKSKKCVQVVQVVVVPVSFCEIIFTRDRDKSSEQFFVER